MKTQVILAAAGDGGRLKADVAKAMVFLKDKPIFIYSLEIFSRIEAVESVIVVIRPDLLARCQDLIGKYAIPKVKAVVPGGATRCASVRKGMAVLDPDTDYVLIHDAARPLVSQGLVEEALRICYDKQAVTVGVPVKPTIKRVDTRDLKVLETLDRGQLWETQTPQIFRKDILTRAHAQVGDCSATDDASLVERSGVTVSMVPGDYGNIKITSPDDLVLAARLLGDF